LIDYGTERKRLKVLKSKGFAEFLAQRNNVDDGEFPHLLDCHSCSDPLLFRYEGWLARNKRPEITIEDLLEKGRGLEQIKGDDPRLAEFWAAAAKLATTAGHCETYDAIAVALGGPARKDFAQ
jgi:hypothetical protein